MITDDQFLEIVQRMLPGDPEDEDAICFRAFPIPPGAKGYDIGNGPVPLRCLPGDVRAGIIALRNKQMVCVTAIEVNRNFEQSMIEFHLLDGIKQLGEMAGKM